jgi:hypothetical protein
VLVLATLGAPERRRLGRRRGRERESASPEPVPTSRATVVRAQPFESRDEAGRWLAAAREGPQEIDLGLAVLNRALRAHRVAAADPHARDVGLGQALAARLGFGSGQLVADGKFVSAWEMSLERPRARRSMEAPDERFAALLGGRAQPLAAEELALRARLDIDGGRPREAALQTRVALEALLAEGGERLPAEVRGVLEQDRKRVAEAAAAALRGDPPQALAEAVEACVGRIEAALRRVRVSGA